jgi:hypothetical protein
MKTIEKVTLEKVIKTYTIGFNCVSNCSEFNRFVYFTNGCKFSVMSLLSEIGNNGLDSWYNIERIKKSTSNKNIQKYLSQFIDKLETCK